MSNSQEPNTNCVRKYEERTGAKLEKVTTFSIFHKDEAIFEMSLSDFELIYKQMTYFIDEINAEKTKK